MKKTGDYYIVVVEDTSIGQIVATASLIIEHKFIHCCAKVGSHSLNGQYSQPYNVAKKDWLKTTPGTQFMAGFKQTNMEWIAQ